MGTEIADLYTGFTKPLLPLPHLAALILVALPAAALLGFRIGQLEHDRQEYDKVPRGQIPGATSLGAMLALLGLLLGFAFSSALSWREARQAALVEEAAAISTAFLSADLLADPGRTDLQRQIIAYARTRIATRSDVRTEEAWNAFLVRTLEGQSRLWPATLRAMGETTSDPIRAAVFHSVTNMLDAHTRRAAAAAEQLPAPAGLLIFAASAAAILLVGNRSALQGRPLTWRTFVFAGMLSLVMIVIFDLDRSLEGTIKINYDALSVAVREMELALADPSIQ